MDPRGFPTTLPEFQRVFPDPVACATYDAHLPMIHIVFSNLKSWILGTPHGISANIQAAISFYLGGGARITDEGKGHIRVTAPGYYAVIGA